MRVGTEGLGRSLALLLFCSSALLLLIGCAKKPPEVTVKTKDSVRSVYVEDEPRLDGAGADPVWRRAPEASIAVDGGAAVKLKSVYTKERIFFLASWTDATPKDGAMYWEFDGVEWNKSWEEDDKIAFIWNINHSINDFDKQGCRSVCHKGADGRFHMAESGPNTGGKIWPGARQKGDAWKWAPGVMNQVDVVDDGIFGLPPDVMNPELASATNLVLIFDGGDGGTKQWWTRNPNGAAQGQPKHPAFVLKPDLKFETTPFPNQRDLIPWDDTMAWKAGDKVPLIMYFDLTSDKNRADFPEGKPSGSRVDITGHAVWSTAAYTLEFARKLNTAHIDDVQFRPEDDRTVAENVFGIALFNDTRLEHSVTGPVTLVLEARR